MVLNLLHECSSFAHATRSLFEEAKASTQIDSYKSPSRRCRLRVYPPSSFDMACLARRGLACLVREAFPSTQMVLIKLFAVSLCPSCRLLVRLSSRASLSSYRPETESGFVHRHTHTHTNRPVVVIMSSIFYQNIQDDSRRNHVYLARTGP